MLSASVSNLDLFRVWKQDEELDVEWLLSRLRGEVEQTEQMKVGEAFHALLENAEQAWGSATGLDCWSDGSYRFDFNCEGTIALPKLRELKIDKDYGPLNVRGRVDGLTGKEITDYKTTGQFDADRLMNSYQWRFYLDMSGCDSFVWHVFVISEFGQTGCYSVREMHTLRQNRYPGMDADCRRLAQEYHDFASRFNLERAKAS